MGIRVARLHLSRHLYAHPIPGRAHGQTSPAGNVASTRRISAKYPLYGIRESLFTDRAAGYFGDHLCELAQHPQQWLSSASIIKWGYRGCEMAPAELQLISILIQPLRD